MKATLSRFRILCASSIFDAFLSKLRLRQRSPRHAFHALQCLKQVSRKWQFTQQTGHPFDAEAMRVIKCPARMSEALRFITNLTPKFIQALSELNDFGQQQAPQIHLPHICKDDANYEPASTT